MLSSNDDILLSFLQLRAYKTGYVVLQISHTKLNKFSMSYL